MEDRATEAILRSYISSPPPAVAARTTEVDGVRQSESASRGGRILFPNLAADALEEAYDAVVITNAVLDPPGPVIVHVNRAFEALTGYSAAEEWRIAPVRDRNGRLTHFISFQRDAGAP